MFGCKISPILRQYISVISAACSFFQIGVHMAWVSPMLIQLKDEKQMVLPEAMTDSQTSWLVAISNLIGTFSLLFTGYLADRLGRKHTIILGYVPRLITCVIFLVTTDIRLLLFARALEGISDVVTCSVNSAYASEVASKEIRGSLGAISQIMSALGSMLILSVGPFLDYMTLNTVITCITVATFIPLLFLPESPYLLYSKGRIKESRDVLIQLRNSDAIENELKEYSLNLSNRVKVNKLELLKDVVVLKTCGKVIILGIGSQMTGSNVIMYYLQTIFESTHTSLRPEISSLIIGCIQVIAGCMTFAFTDKFGRKPILTLTLFGLTIGLVGLGTFFKVKESTYEITGLMNYLPLVSLILVIFCFNAGIGAIIWTLISELFDGPSRAMGVSLGVFVAIGFNFLLTLYFGSISMSIGPASIYWMFAACCAATCLFIKFFLPETKGKAFSEIQRDMGRDNSGFEGNEITENRIRIESLNIYG